MKKKYSIIWSPVAEKTYLNILNYLIKEWSYSTAVNFDMKVQNLLELIQSNHRMCPKSKKNNLRRCSITPQTSLIYRINKNRLELVAFIDNRSNHQY